MNESQAAAVIEADGLCFAYPDGVQALHGLDFSARTGQIVAVMGANGSGKTTLMKVLMRLLRPQAGEVRIDGMDVRQLRPAELYRQVGMVFQNPADQLFAASVEQDVAFGPRNLGLSEAEVGARVEQALAAVEIAEFRQRPVHHLSFGQQKRVCLAGVLAMQPKILLLDEPTGGLDPASETHMIELLVRLNRRQKITIIVSTHAVDLLPVLADRIYVLRRGRIYQEGTPREVLGNPEAAAAAGLRIPLVAQLFYQLDALDGFPSRPLPLTIEEARRQVLQWIAQGRAIARAEGDPT